MPIFGSKGKSKPAPTQKKTEKPKKLPDAEMDKVAGGVKPSSTGTPTGSSDGKTS